MKEGDTSTTRARSPYRSRSNLSPTRNSVRISESPTSRTFEKNIELTTTRLQLERLSKQLEKAGFGPLHPSLLVTTKDSFHAPGTLTDTQGLSLISTLSVLINEYEARGVTIQQQTLERQKAQSEKSPSNLEKETLIQELRAKIQQNEYEIDKLKFEASAAQQRQESQRIRNERIMEAIKQDFHLDATVEPIVSRIVANYEDKLAQLQNGRSPATQKKLNPFEDVPEMPSPTHSTANEVKLIVKLDQTIGELEKVKKERDMLQLQLINESKTTKRETVEDTKGLTTRELIQRDKKQWKLQNGDINGLTQEEMKSLVRDICRRLGITDLENVGSCVEKIELAVKLIPQMEQFIRKVNALILAYSMKTSQSSESRKSLKLPQILDVIRDWAELAQPNEEQRRFLQDIHDALGIKMSSGSTDLCLAELNRIMVQKISSKLYDVPVDVAQQAVSHFRNLFELPSVTAVIPKMNDLFVFYAEVNDGLVRLKDALGVEKNVQPGRVLISASEVIDRYNAASTLSFQKSQPIAT